MIPAPGFRTDINAIRALAVLAVVLFHFNPGWLPGGFAGVDMFYVISGYLMTRIIVSGMDTGSFSFRRFYFARARRIVPALAVLCLVVMVYARFDTTLPVQYEIGADVSASLLFFSNFTFWQQAGYFDPVATEKWLLHTWSLSVEWQFYLAYPLVLVLLKKLLPAGQLRPALWVGAGSSFVFAVWLSLQAPEAAFYLLPTRLWELLAGGIVALLPSMGVTARASRLLVMLGIVLLVSACFVADAHTPWPGLMTLLPVLGVVVILAAQCDRSVLDNAVLQAVGRWSYSIYLWHWPLLVLGNYRQDLALLPYNIDLMAYSIALGFLSWRFVETRRYPRIYTLIYLVTLCWGVYLHITTVAEAPKLTPFTTYDQAYCQDINQVRANTCKVFGEGEQLDFILWGDSHAINLTKFLGETGRYHFASFAIPGCPPFDQARRRDKGGGAVACNSGINDEVFKKILATPEVKNILLTSRWTLYVNGLVIDNQQVLWLCRAGEVCEDDNPTPLQSFTELFSGTVAALAADRNLVILRGTPILDRPGKYYLIGTGDTLTYDAHRRYQRQVDSLLDTLAADNVHIIDIAPMLFDQQGNLVIHRGNRFFFLDDNHLTYYGWQRVADRALPLLESALSD